MQIAECCEERGMTLLLVGVDGVQGPAHAWERELSGK